jgi:hypothetical protein
MNDTIPTWACVAAVVAGLSFFAGHVGELVLATDALDAVLVGLIGIGLAAFGVALWGLRTALAGPRRARIGVRLALVGAALLTLFAVQAVVAVLRTGDVPETFVLFGLGFLLATVGQFLFAPALRPVAGAAWPLPIVAALGTIVALVTAGPVHDLGLVVFEAAWIALGATLLARQGEGERVAGIEPA